MMHFWIQAGENDAGLDLQRVETMQVDSNGGIYSVLDSSTQKLCRFCFQHVEMVQFWIPARGNNAV
jgi:hypothetical protein